MTPAPHKNNTTLMQVLLPFVGFVAGFYANYEVFSAKLDNLDTSVKKLTEVVEKARDIEQSNDVRISKLETYLDYYAKIKK
jgi:ATP-dependent protease HslVU (ClpYQ) peptidase subunit